MAAMPEGDSIHRARLRLDPILTGSTVTYFWAARLRGEAPRVGQQIEAVRAHGKHLLIDFDRALTVDTHLGMNGSWRVTTDDAEMERAARNPRLRVLVSTARGHALCFAAPECRSYRRTEEGPTRRLGPDLTAPNPDLDEVTRRVRFLPPTTLLTDLLLDQRIAAGIGNIFKSETLFARRQYPFATIADVGGGDLRALFASAAELLSRNARTPDQQRSTTPAFGHPTERFFVYRRWRQPCLRCDYPVEREYRGEGRRSTYWCRRCQRRDG